ncbi:hypervirulence associated TUDOR domain-containing protein [Neolewinella persica]|uniref:DUF2945 domain-containing protein n=1 Tax=Neolewinella persica TaxID=70998 RepID=UPI00038012A4|nr:DUF2945 domain-containing protein [Neolewinella persica]
MIRKGSKVSWKWGNGKAEGTVTATYAREITKTIKGNEVTRNGTSDNKALLIEQKDGDEVLKLASEVQHIKK